MSAAAADVTELEKAREEIAHLTARARCAEEETADHRRAFDSERAAVQRHIDFLTAKLGATEEVATERGRQIELVVKEHNELTREIGRLHMETRHLKEMLLRLQQENNELKSRVSHVADPSIQQVSPVSSSHMVTATASVSEPRVMARITPHDKTRDVHAELEAAPPKRKPGL